MRSGLAGALVLLATMCLGGSVADILDDAADALGVGDAGVSQRNGDHLDGIGVLIPGSLEIGFGVDDIVSNEGVGQHVADAEVGADAEIGQHAAHLELILAEPAGGRDDFVDVLGLHAANPQVLADKLFVVVVAVKQIGNDDVHTVHTFTHLSKEHGFSCRSVSLLRKKITRKMI